MGKELDANLAKHVTNPRFGMAHTNDTSAVIRPLSYLRDHLLSSSGAEQGQRRWERYQQSVRDAAQMAMMAIDEVYEWGAQEDRGFAFIALDIVSDSDQNAFVLDVNSLNSFYHEERWPEWFVAERSHMIREASDIIQDFAARKRAVPAEGQDHPREKQDHHVMRAPVLLSGRAVPSSRDGGGGGGVRGGWEVLFWDTANASVSALPHAEDDGAARIGAVRGGSGGGGGGGGLARGECVSLSYF